MAFHFLFHGVGGEYCEGLEGGTIPDSSLARFGVGMASCGETMSHFDGGLLFLLLGIESDLLSSGFTGFVDSDFDAFV